MNKPNSALTQKDITAYTITFWKIVIGVVAFGAILIFSIGLGLFGSLPSFRDLENPKNNLASEVITEDNVVLGTYFVQNRSNVRYDEISSNVINALIATEDKRFYSHSGIDFKRTFTSVFYTLSGRKQGASTITQQLALNLFSKEGRSSNFMKRILQKLQEWIIAVKLERNYTKEEIITMYLNTVDFGAYNTYGIKSAARTYFSTTPDKLSPDQAAVLVGMLKGPSLYSPIRNEERSTARRNVVLNEMEEDGYLSEAEAEKLKASPIKLSFNPAQYGEGMAPYFRAVLKKEIQKLFVEQSITKADGTPYDLDRDGLKIYTTVNSRMQNYAEQAQQEYLKTLQREFTAQWRGKNPFKGFEQLLDQGMKRSDRYRQLKEDGVSEEDIRENFNTKTKMTVFTWKGDVDTLMRPIDSIRYYKMILRNGLMSMDPETGYVKAWVGGANFEHFKYDQVKTGTRQVGSTAKPFTYAVAINNGYSPCYQLPNEPVNIDGWAPKQSKPLPGYLTLKKGLAWSQNWITARVMGDVGATAVATLIKRLGVTTDVPSYPSIALGTFDASLYDMVGAYSTFVNHGIWTEPIYLLRIEDKNGNVLYERKSKVVEAMNEQTAYVMVDMLRGVIDNGTGSRMRWKYGLMNPIGGKTGTTQNNSDGWFIGITPKLVTGVWTGAEDRAVHFLTTNMGEGANTALPIFALYMKRVYADPSLKITKGDFAKPKSGINITLDCGAYTDSTKAKTPLETDVEF